MRMKRIFLQKSDDGMKTKVDYKHINYTICKIIKWGMSIDEIIAVCNKVKWK